MVRPTLLALLLAALLTTPAFADSPAGVALTPDTNTLLAQKDVGNERWSIAFNLQTGQIIGNVFFVDGRSPVFLVCEITEVVANDDPGKSLFTWSCSGNDACPHQRQCPAWTFIADVTLPGAFFLPPP